MRVGLFLKNNPTKINCLKNNIKKNQHPAQQPADDGLLSMGGILSFEKNDIAEHHDEYLGQAIKNG